MSVAVDGPPLTCSSSLRPNVSCRLLHRSPEASLSATADEANSLTADESSTRRRSPGGGVQSVLLRVAGSKLNGPSSILSGRASGASFGTDGSLEKCLLTLSVFFADTLRFAEGLVTLPLGSVVCPSSAVLATHFFLTGFASAVAPVGGTPSATSVIGPSSVSVDIVGQVFFFLVVAVALVALGFFFGASNGSSKGARGGDESRAMPTVEFVAVKGRLPGSPASTDTASICGARHILAAVEKVVGTSSGVGAALVPVRRAGFLAPRWAMSSVSDGNSGEEEMQMRERSSDMVARADKRSLPHATRGVRGGEQMRHARPNRTAKGVEGDRVVALLQIGARWQEDVEQTVDQCAVTKRRMAWPRSRSRNINKSRHLLASGEQLPRQKLIAASRQIREVS